MQAHVLKVMTLEVSGNLGTWDLGEGSRSWEFSPNPSFPPLSLLATLRQADSETPPLLQAAER